MRFAAMAYVVKTMTRQTVTVPAVSVKKAVKR